MKRTLFLFVMIFVTILPSTFAQVSSDPWDPADDQFSTATSLLSPSVTEDTSGPHTLSSTDVDDWFKVSLQKSVTYEFYADGPSDTAAELFAADGVSQVAANDDNGPGINFRLRYQPGQTGVFYLRVHLYDPTQSGSYTLHSLARAGLAAPLDAWDNQDDFASGATPLNTPTPVGEQHGPHTLSDQDWNDWFVLILNQGETYSFSSQGNSDTAAEIYLGDGSTRIAADDDHGENDNFQIIFSPPSTGTYYLRVYLFDSGLNGSYLLQTSSGLETPPTGDEWDPMDDFFEGSTILGEPTQSAQSHDAHTLSATDRFDWFQFTLTAGSVYRFFSSGTSDTLADLFLADGTTSMGTDDNSGDEANFALQFAPNATGKYYLRVRAFQDQDAAYSLLYQKIREAQTASNDRWDPGDDQSSSSTDLGDPGSEIRSHGPHTFSATDREDWFAFHLAAGINYEFWTSGNADTVGELFLGDGVTAITQQDEGGSEYNFKIQFSAVTTGVYNLRVRLFDPGSQGQYTLYYNQVVPMPEGADSWDPADDVYAGAIGIDSLSIFETFHGPHTLSVKDPADWFSLYLTQDATYVFTTTGDSDTVGSLYDSGLRLILQQDDGGTGNNFRLHFTPSVDGVYFLKVSEYGNGSAVYTLSVREEPVLALNLDPAQVYDLNSMDEFTVVPGGYTQQPSGQVETGTLRENTENSISRTGAILTANPGEVILIQFPSWQTGGQPVLLRARLWADASKAEVAFGALDGSLDGSICTNIPADSATLMSGYQWMTLFCNPPSGEIIPLVQLANMQGEQPVTVYLDTVELYTLPSSGSVPSSLFAPNSSSFPVSIQTKPEKVYELQDASEFEERPGGFLGAPAGSVTLVPVTGLSGNSLDGLGVHLEVSTGAVETLLFPTMNVGDDWVLLRARVRREGHGALALAALDGSLDGSIATCIALDESANPSDFQWITIMENPVGNSFIPLVQWAASESPVPAILELDRLEIYRFTASQWLPVRLLESGD